MVFYALRTPTTVSTYWSLRSIYACWTDLEDVCSHTVMLEYPNLFIDITDAKNTLCPMGSTHYVNWAFMHMKGPLDTFHIRSKIKGLVSEGAGRALV